VTSTPDVGASPLIIAKPVYFAPITRERVCCGKVATVKKYRGIDHLIPGRG
jgi:hypothetical protein